MSLPWKPSDVLYDIVNPFPIETPQEIFRSLEKTCFVFDIDKDVYGKGRSIQELEDEVAKIVGKKAGVTLISGIMAQSIALKIHLDHLQKKEFAIHPTSHLEIHENKSYEHIWGFKALLIGDKNRVVTKEDVFALEANNTIPGLIILELPQRENGGVLVSWEDLQAIREWSKKHGVRMHLDGARLWESKPFYGKSYEEICSFFDSVYVSFYKGLGGMVGAMLLGDEKFIEESRIWQRRLGGNVYTYLPLVASATQVLKSNLDTFPGRFEKIKRVVAQISKIEPSILYFNPKEPQATLIHFYIKANAQDAEYARNRVMRQEGILLFVRLRGTTENEVYFEWNMGPQNSLVEDEIFVKGWKTFVDVLKEKQSSK